MGALSRTIVLCVTHKVDFLPAFDRCMVSNLLLFVSDACESFLICMLQHSLISEAFML